MNSIEKQLKELEKKLKKADGYASFNELFNKDFMRKYTDFSSIEEFFKFGGFEVNNQEDYNNLSQEDLIKWFVRKQNLRLGKRCFTALEKKKW
jgi:hypothetical protein